METDVEKWGGSLGRVLISSKGYLIIRIKMKNLIKKATILFHLRKRNSIEMI